MKKIILTIFFISLLGDINAQIKRNYKYILCSENIKDLILPDIPPHIVGCEMIDCCTNCPGPPFGDYTIGIEIVGDAMKQVSLIPISPDQRIVRSLNFENGRVVSGKIILNKKGIISKIKLDKNSQFILKPQLMFDENYIKEFINNKERKISDNQVIISHYLGNELVKKLTFEVSLSNCGISKISGLSDTLKILRNDNNSESIVTLDVRQAGCTNDLISQTINNSFGFENALTNINCNIDTYVFNQNRAAEVFENLPWTNGSDVLSVNVRDPYTIPLSIWILHGDFAANLIRAEADVLRANEVYNNSRMGIQFQAVYHDATQNSNSSKYLRSACCDRIGLIDEIGIDFQRLNIYYTDEVLNRREAGSDCSGKDTATVANGWTCGDIATVIDRRNVLLISISRSNPETLSHEIGHTLNVHHIYNSTGILDVSGDGNPDFTNDNIMFRGRIGRNHFTIGQASRAVFNAESLLNIYGIRQGVTRNCDDTDRTGNCLPLEFNR